MANALSGGLPEVPMPAQGAVQQDPAQPTGAPQQMPAPSHAQTVATLRHTHAIQDELETLLKNPAIGKSSIKSAIIDGATKLVASRIITPAQAVAQLGTVPDDPLEQRKWLRAQLAQSVQAQNAILDHHRAAHAGGDEATAGHQPYDPETHIDTMAGVNDHYKGLRRG
jgi:hypothetical protein